MHRLHGITYEEYRSATDGVPVTVEFIADITQHARNVPHGSVYSLNIVTTDDV